MADAIVEEVAEAANEAAEAAMQTMAQKMGAQTLMQTAQEAAQKATDAVGQTASAIANAMTMDILNRVNDAAEDVNAEIARAMQAVTTEYAEYFTQAGLAEDAAAKVTAIVQDAVTNYVSMQQRATEEATEKAVAEAQEQVKRGVQDAVDAAYAGTQDAVAEKMRAMGERMAEQALDTMMVTRAVEEAQERLDSKKVQHSFAGERSRTADRGLLDAAIDMVIAGYDMETIRQQTGWFAGMDGKWRYEIDDSKAKVSDLEPGMRRMLDEVLRHDKLFEAYPKLRDVLVNVKPQDARGSYSNNLITISEQFLRDASQEEIISTLMHEVQHAIQDIEHFAHGASALGWLQVVQERRRELEDVLPLEDPAYGDTVGLKEFMRARLDAWHRNEITLDDYWAELRDWYARAKEGRIDAQLREDFGGINDTEIEELQQQMDSILQEQSPEMRDKITEYVARMMDFQDAEAKVFFEDSQELTSEDVQERKAQADAVLEGMTAAEKAIMKHYWRLQDMLKKYTEQNRLRTPYELYRDTAGEIEARDVQDRRRLSEVDRQAIPPRIDRRAVQAEKWMYSQRAESVDSEAFREWFRDSEVVDEDGNPVVVFHSTNAEFTAFDKDKIGRVTSRNAANGYLEATAYTGFWFNTKDLTGKTYMQRVVPAYLSAQRLYEAGTLDGLANAIFDNYTNQGYEYDTEDPTSEQAAEAGIEFRRALESWGYDGIVLYDEEYGGTSYVVFEPEQIKSATDNVGTYDPENPDIRYSKRNSSTTPSATEVLRNMQPTKDMTEMERRFLETYRQILDRHEATMAEISRLIEDMKQQKTDEEKAADEKKMAVLKSRQRKLENQLYQAERSNGYVSLIKRYREMVKLFVTNNTAKEAVKSIESRLQEIMERLEILKQSGLQVSSEELEKMLENLVDKKSLKAAVKSIKDNFGTRMADKEIRRRVVMLQAMMLDEGTKDAQVVTDYLRDLLHDLYTAGDARSISAEQTLDMVRTHLGDVLIIDEETAKEIRHHAGSIAEYRRVVGRVIKTVRMARKGESGTADLIIEEAPGWVVNTLFGVDDPNSMDIVTKLYDVVKDALESSAYDDVTPEQETAQMADLLMTAEYAGLPELQTDKVKGIMKNLRDAQGKKNLAADALRDITKELLEAKAEARKIAKVEKQNQNAAVEILKYYQALAEHEALLLEQQVLERNRAALKETVEAWYAERELQKKKRKYIRNIRRKMDWMDKRIRNEQDRKNIKEDLKPVVEEAIRLFIDHNDVLKVFKKKQVANMRTTYETLRKLHGEDLRAADWAEDIRKLELEEQIKSLKIKLEEYEAKMAEWGIAKKTPGYRSDANSQERNMMKRYEVELLEDISTLVNTIWNAVKARESIFLNGQEQDLAEVSGRLGDELRQREDYSKDPMFGEFKQWLKNFAVINNMKPATFFRLIGSDVLMEIYRDLLDAQFDHELYINETRQKLLEIVKKHHYYEWINAAPLTITTRQGRNPNGQGAETHTTQLTVGEALAIYITWIREQQSSPLVTSQHLRNGGFVLRSKRRVVTDKKTKKQKIVYDMTPHKIDMQDMATIGSYLTQEMKDFANDVVKYLSTDIGEMGNYVSMKLYGIRKFTEGFYFPMKVQQESLNSSFTESGPEGDKVNRIANMPSAKTRVDKATKPLEIGDFLAVAEEHIAQMVRYATFAIPIESIVSLMNSTHVEGDQPTPDEIKQGAVDDSDKLTMRGLFAQKYGPDMSRYLSTFIKDLNGGVTPDNRNAGLASKLIGLRNRSAVLASISVTVQQPLAVLRAMYEVDPKYFMRIDRAFNFANAAREWQQLKRYSGAALVKMRGGFDMTRGRGSADYLHITASESYGWWETVKSAYRAVKDGAEGERGAKAKLAATETGQIVEDALGKLPALADMWTWTYIWQGIKDETADNNPGMDRESNEFLEKAGKRFDEVINLTQVYDSVLSRSQIMRSKSIWDKVVTAFMAEPLTTLNMLIDGVHNSLKNGKAKPLVKACGIYVATQVLTALVKALWTALRDDDEEKPYLEKLLDAWGRELGGWSGALNPAALLPWVRDVMSYFDGYDVERTDLSLIMKLTDSMRKATDKDSDATAWERISMVLSPLANLLGVPVSNITRDVKSLGTLWQHVSGDQRDLNVESILYDASKNFVLIPDRDNKYYYTRIYEAMKAGDENEVNDLKEYLTLTGKKATTIDQGVRGIAKERVLAGEMTQDEAVELLVKGGLADDKKAAFTYVDGWIETEKHKDADGNTEEGYSHSVYNSVYDAIDAQDTKAINREIKTLMDNGYLTDKSTLKTQLRKQYRDQYVELSKTNRTKFANMQAALVTALVAVGYKRSEALEYVKGWLKK